ncbi:MAG: hypothetical protein Q9167_004349 [Letrouitia subvulpina]
MRRRSECKQQQQNSPVALAHPLTTPLSVRGDFLSDTAQSTLNNSQKNVTSPLSTNGLDQKPRTVSNGTHLNGPSATQAPNPQAQHHLHKPHLHRVSSDKDSSPSHASVKAAKEQKPSLTNSTGRRNSWISSISSKFSSNTNAATNLQSPNNGTAAQGLQSPQREQPNPFGAAVAPGTKEVKRTDSSVSQPSSPAKSGHPGFLQSALRRFSSGGGVSMGKMAGTGGQCPRKVMNIDPYRERCEIPDFEPSKMRRVAFCVDVEIAAPAKYSEEEYQDFEPSPLERRPSLTQLERQVEMKKKKDQKLRMSEGEALKNPKAVAEEKENLDAAKATGETVENGASSPPNPTVESGNHVSSRKKEKKKRSEEERKERKEKKRIQALENGSKPFELTREDSNSSAAASPPNGSGEQLKSTDKPTTDPLRIYRRCCQLRETPILKRITEQISSPSACPIATPGILTYLDLTGYWMQLPDIITLGDYLQVVPVKKLVLEDCGLGDEAVRVILSGLLGVKTSEQAKHNKKLNKKNKVDKKDRVEEIGAIEKLSLKNNPKIGAEGWRHISYFINMSKSLKAIDLSMTPIPLPPQKPANSPESSPTTGPTWDIRTLLQKCIAERRGGSHMEELVMGECNLDTDMIDRIVDAVMRCGIRRLGLASNGMTREGLEHVIRYLQQNKCEGLDLGGNDLRENLYLLADALDENNPLYALSLADCNISPASLSSLLPALVRLPNFRFIDLSHNRHLFKTRPNALGLLRKYLPQFPLIKRIHLMDVAMTSEHAIALAEILPEIRTLAHLNILENHLISGLASAKNEAEQEEACALYASLMAAVRVSKSIVCIDIDIPSQDSGEVVKALAKQVVAYSLRNMERLPLNENSDTAIAALVDPHGGEKPVAVPDVLLHIVGQMDGIPENHDHDEPAPDDDYIVGGTGVVKALGICLNRAADQRKGSRDMSPAGSGAVTPRNVIKEAEVNKGKAKEMSKNLLSSARKIRARLQPALVKEARSGNEMSYKRLQYLDTTLERMIQRFEDEYPETRLRASATPFGETTRPRMGSSSPSAESSEAEAVDTVTVTTDLEEDSATALKPALARHPSEHSLASRQDAEEGLMHRFGQRMRRDILPPDTLDYAHGTTGTEDEPQHLKDLRSRVEAFTGEEIQANVEAVGIDRVLDIIGATKEELRELERRGGGGESEVIERLLSWEPSRENEADTATVARQ